MDAPAATTSDIIQLTVFDEVNHDVYVPGIFFFHPLAPPIAVLEAGLAKVLAKCREWASRLVTVDDKSGKRAIQLNDASARLVEASADIALSAVMPLPMGPEAQLLHPGSNDAEEVQLDKVTRFPFGSFTVGYNIHHSVADGYTASTCMLAWGQAVRGTTSNPAMVGRDQAVSFFVPRDPPLVEFEHHGVEFKPRAQKKAFDNDSVNDNNVVV